MLNIVQPPTDSFSILCKSWKSWLPRNEKSVPYKSSMVLRDIVKIMPYVATLEWFDNEDGIFRLIGEQLKLLYKMDITGKHLSSISPQHELIFKCHQELISAIVNTPIGTLAHREVLSTKGETWGFDTLSLPLLDADGIVKHGIMCGILIPPKDAPEFIWGEEMNFDLTKATLKSVTPIDVGCGSVSFSAEVHELMTMNDAVSIDDFIDPEVDNPYDTNKGLHHVQSSIK